MSQVDVVSAPEVDSKSPSQEKAIVGPLVKLSPYADIVALRFTDQVLHIHGFLLDKFPESSTMAPNQREIDMTEYSSSTGHALAHFLYTGQYDTADTAPGYDALRSNFEVYSAASKYQLNDLREKAQEAIDTHTEDVTPSKVLSVIKKTCPLPDINDAWLQSYTKSLLEATYTDVASFLDSDLMAADRAEGTMSITEMLLRAVINSERERRELEEQQRAAAEQAEREAREKEAAEAKERAAAEDAERVAKEAEAAELAEKLAKEKEATELAEKLAKELEAAELAERQAKERAAAEVAERDAKIASLYAERDALEHKQKVGMGRLFGRLSKREKARLETVKGELATVKGANATETSGDETEAAATRRSNELEKKPIAVEVVPSTAPGFLGKAAAAECVVQTAPAQA